MVWIVDNASPLVKLAYQSIVEMYIKRISPDPKDLIYSLNLSFFVQVIEWYYSSMWRKVYRVLDDVNANKFYKKKKVVLALKNFNFTEELTYESFIFLLSKKNFKHNYTKSKILFMDDYFEYNYVYKNRWQFIRICKICASKLSSIYTIKLIHKQDSALIKSEQLSDFLQHCYFWCFICIKRPLFYINTIS